MMRLFGNRRETEELQRRFIKNLSETVKKRSTTLSALIDRTSDQHRKILEQRELIDELYEMVGNVSNLIKLHTSQTRKQNQLRKDMLDVLSKMNKRLEALERGDEPVEDDDTGITLISSYIQGSITVIILDKPHIARGDVLISGGGSRIIISQQHPFYGIPAGTGYGYIAEGRHELVPGTKFSLESSK